MSIQNIKNDLSARFNDKYPFLLFPVRIETRFMTSEVPKVTSPDDPGYIFSGAAGKGVVASESVALEMETVHDLCIRVYPDDIAISSHEKNLSEDEIILGKKYWNHIWEYPGNEEKERTAWRALVAAFGANRSAWVVKELQPTNGAQRQGLVEVTAYEAALSAELSLYHYQIGVGYWKDVWGYYGNPTAEETKFNGLVATLGDVNTVLVLTNLTRPKNFNEKPTQASTPSVLPIFPKENEIATIAANYIADGYIHPKYISPAFPTVIERANSWTQASYTEMLPSNFIFTLFDAANPAGRQFLGADIPARLEVSLNPDEANPTLETSLNGEDINVVRDEFKWMVDFQTAVDQGMAISIRLTDAEAAAGFDKVTVFGVSLDKDSATSQKALQNLIEGHQFSKEGFGLVPQGTATNNTDQGSSGFNTADLSADNSFNVTRKGPLFKEETDVLKKKDGQWLAETLGIDKEYLTNVQFANSTDISDSIAMNQTLFNGSVGTYMEVMLKELFLAKDMSTIRRVNEFFTNYVSARGFAPAIRVGTQPYGILTTSVFNKGTWGIYNNGLSPEEENFLKNYQTIIHQMDFRIFQGAGLINKPNAINKPLTAATQSGKEAEAKERFLEILGLSASSVDYFYRYAAGKGHTGDLTAFLDQQTGPSITHSRSNILLFFNTLLSGVNEIDNTPIRMKDSDFYSSLFFIQDSFQLASLGEADNFSGGIIEERPLSNSEGLEKLFDSKTKNYIEKLLSVSFEDIVAEPFNTKANGDKLTKSLLYLMLRHSLLLQYFDACMELLDDAFYHTFTATAIKADMIIFSTKDNLRVIPEEEGARILVSTNGKDFKVYAEFEVIKVHFPENRVKVKLIKGKIAGIKTPALVRVYGNYGLRIRKNLGTTIHINPSDIDSKSVGSIMDHKWGMTKELGMLDPGKSVSPVNYLKSRLNDGKFEDAKKYLKEMLKGMERISKMPTAKLERLFAEHVDLFSYRLDAWRNAMAVHRLHEIRNEKTGGSQPFKKGIYLGTYGWVEDLRPKAKTALPAAEYPTGYDPKTEALYKNESNQGFVHAPSLNHAMTAAVLKAGYLAHANAEKTSLLSVNMSSDRVRMALNYLDGLRNGQTLGALLGYQFERGLHDKSTDTLLLDQYILEFRKKFNLVKDLNAVDDAGVSIESIKARNVVDGIELLKNSLKENGDSAYPFGIPIKTSTTDGLPPLSSVDPADQKVIQAIEAEIDRMRNAMDAIADLSLIESVYGVVQGNYDRTNAILNAVSEGANPPEPEVVHTPRSGYRFTNKLGVLFQPTFTVPTPKKPRGAVEPMVNNWIGNNLGVSGDLGDIRCTVNYISYDAVAEVDVPAKLEVSMGTTAGIVSLGLEPTDFAYLLSNEEGNTKTLSAYIDYTVRRISLAEPIKEGTVLEVNYLDRSELKAPADQNLKMVADVIPLVGSMMEVLRNSKVMNAQDIRTPGQDAGTLENSKGIDHVDLSKRVEYGLIKLNVIKTNLEANETSISDIENVRGFLMDAFYFGLNNAIPNSITGTSTEDETALLEQVVYVLEEITDRSDDATQLIVDAKNLVDIGDKVDKLIQGSKVLFGANYRIIPLFMADDWPSLESSRSNLNTPYIEEDWLNGVAHVRGASSILEDMNFQLDNLDRNWDLQATQLPYDKADKWVGNSDGGPNVNGDRLSLVLHYDGAIKTTAKHGGLIVDEWVEVIPQKEQTTGIAFNYDQPDAEAPQALILAVSPKIQGNWTLDNLTQIFEQTIKEVKKRAIEPDHLYQADITFGLPAIMHSALNNVREFSLDFGSNVGVSLDDKVPYLDAGGKVKDYSAIITNPGSITTNG